jgi:NADH-quinone oxidoreductase subunit H
MIPENLDAWQIVLLKTVFALVMVSVVMGIAAYSVLAERKVSSWIQGRIGPNRTTVPILGSIPAIGPFLTKLGIFQPVADGLKFLFKEEPVPAHVNKLYYNLAPVIAMVPALVTMVIIPFGGIKDGITGEVSTLILANVDIGILFLFAIGSLGVYGIVLGAWASNNKYSFMGGIRSSAQMISYELTLGLAVLPVLMWANPPGSEGGLSLIHVVNAQEGAWNLFWQPLSALLFLVAIFAETNRAPFDMPESETDLVGGFHTEYGAFKFGMFFVAEYAHIVIGSSLFVLLFLGGWNLAPGFAFPWPSGILGAFASTGVFLGKVCCLIFFFIWIRWTLPRFRYDQVMKLGWSMLLPAAVVNFVLNILIIALHDITHA